MAIHLVTGGVGFVGDALVQELRKANHQVRVVDVMSSNIKHSGVEYQAANILDILSLKKIFEGVDVVHHLAAAVPLVDSREAFENINVKGTEIVCRLAIESGAKHFNFMSSSAVYGEIAEGQCPIPENTPTKPFEDYGKSKLRAEEIVLAYAERNSKISFAILRPRTVLGPGRLGIFDLLFNWVSHGSPVYLIGDGSNHLQLLDIRDLVCACRLISEQNSRGIFNLGAKDFGTLKENIENLISHAKSQSTLRAVPATLAKYSLFILEKLRLSPFVNWHYRTFHRDYFFDISKANHELGWSPQFSNNQTLNDSYDWYIQNAKNFNYLGSIHNRPLKRRFLSLFMK